MSQEPSVPARKKKRATSSPQKQPKVNPIYLIIPGVLVLALCSIGLGVGLSIFLNQPQPNVVAAAPTPAGPPTATLLPTETPTPRPTATSMLPQAKATAEPTPVATYAVSAEFINKDKIQEIIQFTEQWRELTLPNNLPIEFQTRAQLRQQWSQDSFDSETLQVIQTQKEFYAAMGLMDPNVNLVEATLNSQASILMGYYTPEDKTMFVIADSVNMFAEEEMTFAHEYVHALQDHHFNLNTFLTKDLSGDALLAARSLPEGDARLVEDLFTWQNISQDQLDYTVYRYLFQEQPPAIEGVSPALGVFTYFPYTAGEYFVIYLYIEGGFSWKLVNQAYSNPPISSEQVLHPEKYLAGERPLPVTMPNLANTLGSEWYQLDQGMLGEAGFLVWLYDQVEDQPALNAAAGWDGDGYTLWVDNTNQRILAESSLWETATEAAEFVAAFKQYVALREPAYHQFDEAGATIFEYNGGTILVRQQDRKVLIVIAPNRTLLYNVRDQF